MAKEKTGAALKTFDLFKRPRGRPPTGDALTGAQRVKKLRDHRRKNGLCPYCGQPKL